VILTDEQRAALVAEAVSWAGTPWHHAARIKGAGVDCGMFVLEVYERCGLVAHYEPKDYPRDWHMNQRRERFREIVEQFCEPTQTPLPGDVVCFRWGHCVSHGGIVIAWPEIIHAYIDHGVIRDDAQRNSVLSKRLAGFYTLRGAA
jgi:cell wall-associated NlpC family hydrolase